ncbi:MAG: DUF58 domain-containing protein [Pseudorhodobacter sp.]|nr:DUF58 domain-containing protein [Rhizobacter sp.]
MNAGAAGAAVTPTPTPTSGPAPLGLRTVSRLVQRRFRKWWQSRLPVADKVLLTQRNVYILPTKAGLLFALTLFVLLLATINYQLNLGYVLTFLLAGCGVVSMHLTHGTLRGLNLHLRAPAAVFAGEPVMLETVLSSPAESTSARYGIGMKIEAADWYSLAWVDVPAGAQFTARVSFVPATRGRHGVPALSAETRFPTGLFRAWAVWRPAAQVMVYPAPERPAKPLPAAFSVPGGTTRQLSHDGGEVEGIRAYRRGDPLKMVVWKKAAKAMEAGGELVSRDMQATAHRELWLDWHSCHPLPGEQRLSRLTSWVVEADRQGARYGLRVPGFEATPNVGEAHKRACLEALALCA